ncbi:MAG: lamin tail domain-containing protein [Thaumarchaeota archaeon]|nr:lamin tail domain-containing protein [Nitrososphaerota archaeon]MBI3641106.1 lamin tail domain-containing protein [Nitrososphaerota archaeon]
MIVQMRDPRLYLVIGFLAVVMLCVQVNPIMGQVSSTANHVVLNEVEIDPTGDDSKSILQWVELYNPTSQPVNIGGWTIGATTGLRNTYTISAGTIIQSGKFLAYTNGPSWFPHIGAVVQLKNTNGMVIDQTTPLYDQQNDFNTWQRIADGFNTNSTSDWAFKIGTPNTSNGKLASTGTSSSFGITVATDKTNYIFGDVIKISGQVSKQVNVPNLSYIPEPISIVVTGLGFQKTITTYPDIHLQYETDLKTDQLLGFKEGNYKISVTYSDASANVQFTLSEQAYAPPPQQAPTTLTFITDKPSYILGDTITIVGNVSKIIPLTPVTYTVYDPNSAQIYNGNLFPDSQGRITSYNYFHRSSASSGVVINSVNPVYGTYNIIAKYDTTTTTTSFNLIQPPTLSAPIVVTTNKQAYGPGDPIIISGRTNLIGVYDFQIEIVQSQTVGAVRQNFDVKNQLNVSPDGSFKYQISTGAVSVLERTSRQSLTTPYQLSIPNTGNIFGSYRVIISEKSYKAQADFNIVQDPSIFVATNSGPLSITTDQSSYAIGDPVAISGNIASNQVTTATSLVITVLNENGTALISKANPIPNLSGGLGTGVVNAPMTFYAYPDSNGNYKLQETLYRSVFEPGTYTLKATYNKLTTTTSFSVYDPLLTGNQAVVASTDKQVYGIGETVHLTGKLSSFVDTSSYTITLTLPDGSIITNPLTITNGFFSWDWTIPNSSTDHGTLATIINSGRQNVVTINNYPNTFGIYRITIGSNHAKIDLFFGVSKNSQSETKLSPFFIETDKADYITTQRVQIFGQVIPQVNAATLEQNTMINIGVFANTGQEVFRATVQVNPGGQFQTSIGLRPGSFQTGTYKIFGNYLEASSEAIFNVTDPFTTSSNKLSLLLTTDNDKYLPGQTVLITGRTSFIVSINSVDISVGLANDTIISEGQVVSKEGSVLPKATVPFDQTSSFSYDYKIPNNAKPGNYAVMAKVPFGVFSAPFQIVNQLPNVVTPPQENATQGNTTPENTTQGTPQVITPSITPSTIGPTQKTILSNNITIDKVNRITDSFIPITTHEKTIGNSTFYPRMIDGLLRVNHGDESNVNLKVTFEDGTCLIGQDSNCKITGSTQHAGSLYQTIQIGNQNFLVGYTGSGARLEKFTILPADENAVIQDGQFNVQILKKDEPSRFYYQITSVSK